MLTLVLWRHVCKQIYIYSIDRQINIVRINSEERENQKDATIRCLLSTSVSTCFEHHYAHLQENKDRVLLHVVYCAGCGW